MKILWHNKSEHANKCIPQTVSDYITTESVWSNQKCQSNYSTWALLSKHVPRVSHSAITIEINKETAACLCAVYCCFPPSCQLVLACVQSSSFFCCFDWFHWPWPGHQSPDTQSQSSLQGFVCCCRLDIKRKLGSIIRQMFYKSSSSSFALRQETQKTFNKDLQCMWNYITIFIF